mgnify:CR=1 FL=1
MSYFEESEAHEWGPGGQPSASKQIDIYEKSNKRQSAKNFLNKFATGVNESMESDRNRSSNTEAAQGGRSSSASKDSDDKVRSGMAKLGDDVSVQEGYRPGEWTMEGTPGRKGILGHAARGVGMAFAPATGGLSMAAGNFAGDRLDYV